MSSLLGRPGDRWPLPRVIDALAQSARWAGVPGLIWFAGIWYPSLNVNVETLRAILALLEGAFEVSLPWSSGAGEEATLFLPLAPRVVVPYTGPWELIGLSLVLLVPVLIVFRLNVGLARVSTPDQVPFDAQRRRIRALRGVWYAGRGLGPAAFGMWITLMALLVGSMAFLFGPLLIVVQLLGLQGLAPILVALVVPVAVMVLGYGVVLQVVNQLALHSLAHNRRGVVSALNHAWRLTRNDPWTALRAGLVDLFLFLLTILVALVLGHTLQLGGLGVVALLASYALLGFAGVTRAGFWARTYRALGGLLPADRVPGLPSGPA